jgi:hypothetical protein
VKLKKISLYAVIVLVMILVDLACLAGAEVKKTQMKPNSNHYGVPAINAILTYSLFSQGRLILADAHNEKSYQRKHILGAISLPNDKIKTKLASMRLPTQPVIAIYCG